VKVVIIAHSLIAERQFWFVEELRRQGVDVLEIYPKKWINLEREGGFEIENPGNFLTYYFNENVFKLIEKFSPDLIYSWTEFYQRQSAISYKWAKKSNVPIIYFVYENIQKPVRFQDCYVIAGNQDAFELHNADLKMLHCGINENVFKPMKVKKEFDFVFMSRNVPEKRGDLVKKAAENIGAKLLWKKEFLKYEEIPAFLQRAHTLVSPPIDTKTWKTQGPEYLNLEALFSGLDVITTYTNSQLDWLLGAPKVEFVEQNNLEDLETAMKWNMEFRDEKDYTKWFVDRFSNRVIAGKLIKIFEEVVQEKHLYTFEA